MKLIELALHALCVIVAVVGAVGLAVYTAAALAIVKAGEVMEEMNEPQDDTTALL